jgi:hypothetical protein
LTSTGAAVDVMAGMQDAIVAALLDRHGQTFAEESGIRVRDEPASLFQATSSSL